MPLLQAEDLILGYDSRVIVERLNFKVEKGDYLCIVGNNGSGKTTLMRTILGLQDPLGGRITFGDGLRRNEIRRRDRPRPDGNVRDHGLFRGPRYGL